MAETASILCPDKRVLIPDLDAGLLAGRLDHRCAAARLEGAAPRRDRRHVREHDRRGQGADRLLLHLGERGQGRGAHLREHGSDTEILFGPDMFLGAYVEKSLGRPMHVWDGECHVHAGIRPADIASVRAAHPGADFLIHPECGCSTSVMEYVAAGDVDSRRRAHALDRRDARLRRGERTGGRARPRSSRPRPACSTRCARPRPTSSSSPPTRRPTAAS